MVDGAALGNGLVRSAARSTVAWHVLICAVVWSAGYIFLWIARRFPALGWLIFGLFSGPIGGGRRRWW